MLTVSLYPVAQFRYYIMNQGSSVRGNAGFLEGGAAAQQIRLVLEAFLLLDVVAVSAALQSALRAVPSIVEI
jgi:hypothetical protein